MYGRFGDDDEQGGSRIFPTAEQRDANSADAAEWANAYAYSNPSAPPMVSTSSGLMPNDSGAPGWRDWFGMGSKVVTGLVDVFGRPIAPSGQPVPPQQSTGLPLAALIAIGVGGVVVLGIAARSFRSQRSYAGYRRSKRRSRR